MEPTNIQAIALLRRSREFVEQQMHLFVGKLLRGRVAGVNEGKPRLNFGSFSVPFESPIDFEDGEIATFRVVKLSTSHITLGFVRREGVGQSVTGEGFTGKVTGLLQELKFPVDGEHAAAVRNLLKAGFAATRGNIRAAVALKADPGGETFSSQVLRGLLLRGTDIPSQVLSSLRGFLSAMRPGEALPESAYNSPSPGELSALAGKLGNLRGQDNVSIEAQVLVNRILASIKPVSSGTPNEITGAYQSAAQARIGAEAALARGFGAFIPKFIASLHPNDGLRVMYQGFIAALKEQGFVLPASQTMAATGAQIPALPIEILPAFIGLVQNDPSLLEGFKDLTDAFASYLRNLIIPGASEGTATPSGPEARQLQNNAALNLGRLVFLVDEAMRDSESPPGRELLNAILNGAQLTASRGEGMRIAEWLFSPIRPGAENLPVIGFTLPDGRKGSISLHPGVKRREDGEEEVPAGGRLVFEGEGIGKIEIGLEYGKEGLSAVFVTGRENTHKVIQAGLPELKANLEARGIVVKLLRSVLRLLKAMVDGPDNKADKSSTGLDVKA